MQSEMRKLAELLRNLVEQASAEKNVKCAHAAQALTGLAILRRKIG